MQCDMTPYSNGRLHNFYILLTVCLYGFNNLGWAFKNFVLFLSLNGNVLFRGLIGLLFGICFHVLGYCVLDYLSIYILFGVCFYYYI